MCHLDVVTRIAGIQVRFSKEVIGCSFTPTKDLEDDVYCQNVFCIKDPRTVSHADQLYLALTFADLKEIVVNFKFAAKARKVATRNMCIVQWVCNNACHIQLSY